MVNQKFIDFRNDLCSLLSSSEETEKAKIFLTRALVDEDPNKLETLYKRVPEIKNYFSSNPRGLFEGIREFCERMNKMKLKRGSTTEAYNDRGGYDGPFGERVGNASPYATNGIWNNH